MTMRTLVDELREWQRKVYRETGIKVAVTTTLPPVMFEQWIAELGFHRLDMAASVEVNGELTVIRGSK
jgi:hypothetical protein